MLHYADHKVVLGFEEEVILAPRESNHVLELPYKAQRHQPTRRLDIVDKPDVRLVVVGPHIGENVVGIVSEAFAVEKESERWAIRRT